MLLRIAPDMFIDNRFECVTVREVRNELFQKSKFKRKYPWREDFKNKVNPSTTLLDENMDFHFNLEAIRLLINEPIINSRTDRIFGLSLVDMKIAAYCLTFDLELSSVDQGLIDFMDQQFEKSTISPLGIVNEWIRKGLIVWNNDFQGIIKNWDENSEAPQPIKDIRAFEKLTGYRYEGP